MAIVTGVVAITHGLQIWQQVILAACFVLMFAWAVTATLCNVLGFHAARIRPGPPASSNSGVAAESQQRPPLSASEQQMLDRTNNEIRLLTLPQKVALASIYREPGLCGRP
jgi:hypothetical protein